MNLLLKTKNSTIEKNVDVIFLEKRYFERLKVSSSLLGFGCMRFPTKDGRIDRELSQKMIDRAVDAGVNYFDTAVPYHERESEAFLGEALKKHDRSSLFIATKLPCWEIESAEDAERVFEDQLERLQTDYVDFYLLHALNRNTFKKMLSLGVVNLLERLKAKGKIRFIGFSFHDSQNAFVEIINHRAWDFCMIQLNYMDLDDQAGLKGYHLTEKFSIPLIVMEPLKGGALASLPDDVEKVLCSSSSGASAASVALRFIGSLPNVKVVLSGMSSPEQLEDNLKTFENFRPLSDAEINAVKLATKLIEQRVKSRCTFCRYCMPCPAGVDIPRNFRLWNQSSMFLKPDQALFEWSLLDDEKRADKCIECGKCEKACPQKIKIREDLRQVTVDFATLEK